MYEILDECNGRLEGWHTANDGVDDAFDAFLDCSADTGVAQSAYAKCKEYTELELPCYEGEYSCSDTNWKTTGPAQCNPVTGNARDSINCMTDRYGDARFPKDSYHVSNDVAEAACDDLADTCRTDKNGVQICVVGQCEVDSNNDGICEDTCTDVFGAQVACTACACGHANRQCKSC